jgi:hypothetical protein
MFESNPALTEAKDKLKAYFASVSNGAFCSWHEIEAATGVRMATQRNRTLARRAVEATGRLYQSVSGEGVCVSDESNAPVIADGQRRKVGRAVGRAKRRTNGLLTAHREKMPQQIAQRLELQACGYGAVQIALRDVPKPPPKRQRAQQQRPVFPVGIDGSTALAMVK